MLDENGVMGFIIPDSLFATQNSRIRKILCDYMHINVIARLGEKYSQMLIELQQL